ncbi:MAG: recombinase family protein, partial [Pseudolabrys sp.]|nr:recombinase family protein [Pseudolabrys sp.]
RIRNGTTPPLGYKIVEAERRGRKIKNKLDIDAVGAETVRLIFKLYVNGDGAARPHGVKETTKGLNSHGYRARRATYGVGPVHNILTNACYSTGQGDAYAQPQMSWSASRRSSKGCQCALAGFAQCAATRDVELRITGPGVVDQSREPALLCKLGEVTHHLLHQQRMRVVVGGRAGFPGVAETPFRDPARLAIGPAKRLHQRPKTTHPVHLRSLVAGMIGPRIGV